MKLNRTRKLMSFSLVCSSAWPAFWQEVRDVEDLWEGVSCCVGMFAHPITNLTVVLRDCSGMVDLCLVWWQLFSVSFGVFRIPLGFLMGKGIPALGL